MDSVSTVDHMMCTDQWMMVASVVRCLDTWHKVSGRSGDYCRFSGRVLWCGPDGRRRSNCLPGQFLGTVCSCQYQSTGLVLCDPSTSAVCGMHIVATHSTLRNPGTHDTHSTLFREEEWWPEHCVRLLRTTFTSWWYGNLHRLDGFYARHSSTCLAHTWLFLIESIWYMSVFGTCCHPRIYQGTDHRRYCLCTSAPCNERNLVAGCFRTHLHWENVLPHQVRHMSFISGYHIPQSFLCKLYVYGIL